MISENDSLNQMTTIAHALADSNRIRLVLACLDRERCVCQLVELLDLSNASISKHLGTLRRAGLLVSRREGRWVHYRIPEEPDKIVSDALGLIHASCRDDKAIVADRARLRSIDEVDPGDLARMQREGCCRPNEKTDLKKECCYENK